MAKKRETAKDILGQYSRQGKQGTEDFSKLSTAEKRRKVKVLLADAKKKVEGSASDATTAQSKKTGKGQKVIAAGRTQGLRKIQEVAEAAGFKQYIPALKFYDAYLKDAVKDLETAKEGGWKEGNSQKVKLGDRTNRNFTSEDEYLDHLYSRLEEFEDANTSTNKGAVKYYVDNINAGLDSKDKIKAKTIKTLFGYGAEEMDKETGQFKQGEGAWQKLGAELQKKSSDYWDTIRKGINNAKLMGYESETVIDTYDNVQQIIMDNSLPINTEQFFQDIFTSSNLARVDNIDKRVELIARDYGAETINGVKIDDSVDEELKEERKLEMERLGLLGDLSSMIG